MARPYTCVFSFYGGKSRIAQRYPNPTHDTVIEPFCGGAGYSLRHYQRQVLLNDANPQVHAIWRYLLNTPVDVVLARIPDRAEKGDDVRDWLTPEDDPGLLGLLRAGCNMGTMGSRGDCHKVSWFAAKQWHQVRGRIEYWLPKIGHWRVSLGGYDQVPNERATWFIDPPYANEAGRRYAVGFNEYEALGAWCRERRGQVIVCENAGAEWLPFEPLCLAMTRGGVRESTEVVYVQEEA